MIFDVLLLGVVKALLPKEPKLTDKERYYRNLAQRNGFGRSETSMECLAFDSLHAQAKFEKEAVTFKDLTEDVHRDIVDDGGPDW
jgi:hypothetical protein